MVGERVGRHIALREVIPDGHQEVPQEAHQAEVAVEDIGMHPQVDRLALDPLVHEEVLDIVYSRQLFRG